MWAAGKCVGAVVRGNKGLPLASPATADAVIAGFGVRFRIATDTPRARPGVDFDLLAR